jgi:hypothetical protein
MNFAYPAALLLLLLLVPVGVLYWLRVRVRPRVVGAAIFWQKALAEEAVRWRWRRWRPMVSLILEILIVALFALAAAGPHIPASTLTVLVIDNSASMSASDVGPSRLDEAKEIAKRLIEGLRSCDEIALVRVCPRPEEIQPMTSDRSRLSAAVVSVPQTTDDPSSIHWAVRLSQGLPAPYGVSPQIVLITDGCDRKAVREAEAAGAKVIRVGKAVGNLAITGFAARRCQTDPKKCEAFVEARNFGDQSVDGEVLVEVDGMRRESAPFSIKKDGRWQHVFALDLPEGTRLTARFARGDAYVNDDVASLEILPGSANDVARASLPSDGTDLRVPSDIGMEASDVAVEKPRSPLWILLAAVAAGLVIVEWCLYQRLWTC